MKTIIKLVIFIMLIITQLALLGYQTYKGVKQGTVFSIPVTLYDPYDPLKGRYLNLRYKYNQQSLEDYFYLNDYFSENTTKMDVFITFSKKPGEEYHTISYIYPNKPDFNKNLPMVKATIFHYTNSDSFYIEFPFDQYYIQENYAQIAEKLVSDNSKSPVLVISTDPNGEARIDELLIDGKPIITYIEQNSKVKK